MENTKATTELPKDFILDITNIPGSGSTVCLKTIEHYKKWINHESEVIRQIAKAMVGNLEDYYSITNIEGSNFQQILPHLSNVANFMDSKSTPNMDIQSTARIKSFYSAYEKLLLLCSLTLENHEPIPEHGLAKDFIATRDVLFERYKKSDDLEENYSTFYNKVYATILEFMDYIDNLSQENPEYGFEEIEPDKQFQITKPIKYIYPLDSRVIIPEHDFTTYALAEKKIPEVYRYLASLSPKLKKENILQGLTEIQAIEDINDIENPEYPENILLVQALKKQIKHETFISFRNKLEQTFLDSIDKNNKGMITDYKKMSYQDFLYIYTSSLKPEYKDILRILSKIDSSLQKGESMDFILPILQGGEKTEKILIEALQEMQQVQKESFKDRIEAIQKIDLNNFEHDFEGAKKIQHYANCSKDYMRHPKDVGYQSFHISIKTPFGSYEKQFRTEEQNEYAEFGFASHINYKPYENKDFHRLKVPTPLIPKENEQTDIKIPIVLEPLTLEQSIKSHYHNDFRFYSEGLTMEEFKKAHPDPEDFDNAMLQLSLNNRNEKLLDRIYKALFKKNFKKDSQSTQSTDDSDPHDDR